METLMIGMLYLYEFWYSNEAKITVGRGRCIVRMVRVWTWCDQICGRYSTDFNSKTADRVSGQTPLHGDNQCTEVGLGIGRPSAGHGPRSACSMRPTCPSRAGTASFLTACGHQTLQTQGTAGRSDSWFLVSEPYV